MNAIQKPTNSSKSKFVGILLLVGVCACFAQSVWEYPRSLSGLSSVAQGKNISVAVSGKTILTSSDGSVWTNRNADTGFAFVSVSYGNNLFHIIGVQGGKSDSLGQTLYRSIILSSSDGIAWTKRFTDSMSYFNSVMFGNGQFVSVGSGPLLNDTAIGGYKVRSSIAYSSDGIAWSKSAWDTTFMLLSVTYGNNQFLAGGMNFDKVGGWYTRNGIFLSSSDGSAWAPKYSASPFPLSLTYGNTKFVGLTKYMRDSIGKYYDTIFIVSSSDGSTWQKGNIAMTRGSLNSIAFGNSQFVAVGNDSSGKQLIFGSTDGNSWTQKTSGITGLTSLNSVNFGNNQFMAVGKFSGVITSADGVTWTTADLTSYDGIIWRNKYWSTTKNLRSVAFGSKGFVVVGDTGTILTSLNGDMSTWTERSSGTQRNLLSVAFGDNIYAAVGDTGRILVSSDGINWTIKNSGTYSNISSIIYGNNRFVAVGDSGKVLTSTNGLLWNTINTNVAIKLLAITYANNLYVAVGLNGAVVTSTDGLAWNKIDAHSTATYRSIVYVNGSFIAFNGFSAMLSPDGMSWNSTNIDANGMELQNVNSVVCLDTQMYAVGEYGGVRFSSDGLSWQDTVCFGYAKWSGITYGGNKFVAVGSNGMIAVSNKYNNGTIYRYSHNTTINEMKVKLVGGRILIWLPPSDDNYGQNVSLFALSGKKIFSSFLKVANGMFDIPASGYPGGIYYISIANVKGNKWSTKVILLK